MPALFTPSSADLSSWQQTVHVHPSWSNVHAPFTPSSCTEQHMHIPLASVRSKEQRCLRNLGSTPLASTMGNSLGVRELVHGLWKPASHGLWKTWLRLWSWILLNERNQAHYNVWTAGVTCSGIQRLITLSNVSTVGSDLAWGSKGCWFQLCQHFNVQIWYHWVVCLAVFWPYWLASPAYLQGIFMFNNTISNN